MSLSEEQPVFLGNCIHCQAKVFRINGKVIPKNPAPDCLCEVKEETNGDT